MILRQQLLSMVVELNYIKLRLYSLNRCETMYLITMRKVYTEDVSEWERT